MSEGEPMGVQGVVGAEQGDTRGTAPPGGMAQLRVIGKHLLEKTFLQVLKIEKRHSSWQRGRSGPAQGHLSKSYS